MSLDPLVVNADRLGRTLVVVTVSANAEDDIRRNAISQRISRTILRQANQNSVEAAKIPFPPLVPPYSQVDESMMFTRKDLGVDD